MSKLFSVSLALISIWLLKLTLFKVNSTDQKITIQPIIAESSPLPLFDLEKEKLMGDSLLDDYNLISQKARSITVKVLAGKSWGSGIVIDKQDNVYTVITNRHVLIFATDQKYQIQTPDGRTYSGKILNTVDFGDLDLALVQFQSDRLYQKAIFHSIALNSATLTEEKVFAGGYPMEINNQEVAEGFYLNKGNIARLSHLQFGGGYQIGYTNSVKKGMSGGPLINTKGEVIGINGVHKYPLWGNPYLFSDGSLATEAQKEEMSQFSWAIPINTLLELAPQFRDQKIHKLQLFNQ